MTPEASCSEDDSDPLSELLSSLNSSTSSLSLLMARRFDFDPSPPSASKNSSADSCESMLCLDGAVERGAGLRLSLLWLMRSVNSFTTESRSRSKAMQLS